MKKYLLIVLFLSSFISVGQKLSTGIIQKEIFKDSTNGNFKTIKFEKSKTKFKNPIVYLDSLIISQNSLQFLNADDIQDLKIEKGKFEINGLTYNGKILIKSKNPNQSKFVTLKEISDKFTDCNSKHSIYKINNNYIFDDISLYKIEIKNILNITIISSDLFENLSEKINFDIIQILTKTKENMNRPQQIIIR